MPSLLGMTFTGRVLTGQSIYKLMDPKQKPYKFVVRLPLALRMQIADAAQHFRRSMNSEIVARLEQSFSGLTDSPLEDQIAPEYAQEIETYFNRQLSHEEQQMLRAFRRLPADKQASLLELLT